MSRTSPIPYQATLTRCLNSRSDDTYANRATEFDRKPTTFEEAVNQVTSSSDADGQPHDRHDDCGAGQRIALHPYYHKGRRYHRERDEDASSRGCSIGSNRPRIEWGSIHGLPGECRDMFATCLIETVDERTPI